MYKIAVSLNLRTTKACSSVKHLLLASSVPWPCHPFVSSDIASALVLRFHAGDFDTPRPNELESAVPLVDSLIDEWPSCLRRAA